LHWLSYDDNIFISQPPIESIQAAIDAAVEETVEVGVVDAETGALTGDTVSTVISTASKVSRPLPWKVCLAI